MSPGRNLCCSRVVYRRLWCLRCLIWPTKWSVYRYIFPGWPSGWPNFLENSVKIPLLATDQWQLWTLLSQSEYLRRHLWSRDRFDLDRRWWNGCLWRLRTGRCRWWRLELSGCWWPMRGRGLGELRWWIVWVWYVISLIYDR